jgi:hypothetical protein
MQRLFCFAVALILLLVGGWLTVDRIAFLSHARRTEGRVTSITGFDTTCGGRRTRRPCTEFTAKVQFTPQETGQTYSMNVDAGTASGSYQSIERANRRLGQAVQVAYHPDRPATAYEDTFWGVWCRPMQVFFFTMLAFLFGLPDRSRNSSGDGLLTAIDIATDIGFDF